MEPSSDSHTSNVGSHFMEKLTVDAIEQAVTPLAYELLKKLQIAGAAVAVVRAATPLPEGTTELSPQDQIQSEPLIYCRGYGFEDVENGEVINIHESPFDCGSCACILTAIGALELWQEDAVDLDRDVNQYLAKGLQVDNIFPAPVTLSRLLSHTSGYSDGGSAKDGSQDSSGDALTSQGSGSSRPGSTCNAHTSFAGSSEEESSRISDTVVTRQLKANQQVRVSPPGTLYRDSEYNYLLIGSIIEQSSGMDYTQFVKERLLEPLQLNCTRSFLPGEASSNTSPQSSARRPKAYSVTEVMHRKVERMLISSAASPPHLTPVTGLSATPTEMSRLLLACLQAKEGTRAEAGVAVLSEKALHKMHASHFSAEETEVAYGFRRKQMWENGPTLLFHSADESPGADSLFCLFPHFKIGVWIGCNTTPDLIADDLHQPVPSGRFCEEVLEALVQHLMPMQGRCKYEQGRWFQKLPPLRADPLLDLFCFPCVGGSAPVMYEAWCSMRSDGLPIDLRIVVVDDWQRSDGLPIDLRIVVVDDWQEAMAFNRPAHRGGR
ncbi:hypothetical protein CYMTET_30263 [Cymbomonas tetramitiformis]|uniref:Beta-lactamase-related domain-containing protein n=1 Tax=Cymbomonas tetramitiformis TaxID=36881 RepID=A0AAE0FJ73_9CHLO|nr:hypothetical protein CYMTET_30263 [Cymbomonas tetramitiformis]